MRESEVHSQMPCLFSDFHPPPSGTALLLHAPLHSRLSPLHTGTKRCQKGSYDTTLDGGGGILGDLGDLGDIDPLPPAGVLAHMACPATILRNLHPCFPRWTPTFYSTTACTHP